MKVPKEVKKLFETVPYMALATADQKGKPNVVAIGSKKIINDKTIWVIDTYFNKTKQNILENDRVSIALWRTSSEGYQIKGKAIYHSEGRIFDEGRKWVLKLKPKKIIKGVVEIRVTEVYSIAANYEEAGKRIV